MKKVMQTKTGIGGNCEGATLATLLGLSINDIPDFWEGCDKSKPTCTVEGAKYQANLNNFLASKGLKAISLGFHEPSEDSEKWVQEISKAAGIKHLVNGISPRGYMHSVIYENGQLWHDPHPQGGGVKPCQITFLHPIFDDEAAWQAAKAKAVPEGFVLVPAKNVKYFSNDGENYEIHDTLAEAKHEAECAIEHFSERLADQLCDPREDGNFQNVGYGVVLGTSSYSIDHVVTQEDVENGEYGYEVGTEIMSLFLVEAQEQVSG